MKFNVTSGELVRGLSSVIGAVPTKATLPILETILFELNGTNLTLTATDLDITIVETISADIEVEGAVCIPAKRMLETLRQLPDIPLFFEVSENHTVSFKTDKGKYKIAGEDADEFPEVPTMEESVLISSSTDILLQSIKKTLFAVSSDDLRPAMMGVYFKMNDFESRIVATDGHRLVRLVRKDLVSATPIECIVPEKALSLVLKTLHEKEVDMIVSENHCMFQSGRTMIVTRLINEVYPNYESVIPQDNDKRMVISKSELLATVKRVSVFSSSSNRQIRISLNPNSVDIQAEDIDMSSEAKESVLCEYEGEPMMMGFNARYLGDVLNNVDGEQVHFEFSSPNRAGIVRPEVVDDQQNMLMLVMPVMLNSSY